MFDTLLASKIGSSRWARPAAAAILLHLGVVVVALGGTAPPPTSPPAARDTILLEIGRPASPKRQPAPHAAPPNPHSIIPGPPRPPDIQLLPPELDLSGLDPSTPLDPAALSGVASAPDVRELSSTAGGLSSVFAATEVDQLPEIAHDLRPQYPEALRRSGLSGVAQLEYVISADGLVDSATIRVLQSTHPAFGMAAWQAIRGARFRPARRGGQTVAVLVQQTIRFLTR